MARIRIYTDTSVIGGCEDIEFKEHFRRLIGSFARGESVMVLSDITLRELNEAPTAVRAVLRGVPEEHRILMA